jgi:hypothetical protein
MTNEQVIIMNWIDERIEDYCNWLRKKTFAAKDDSTEWHVITTPFLGLFNDNIEIYAKKDNEKIILSDDGVTFSNLELAGVPVTRSSKRKEWLDMILLNYGVMCDNEELKIVGYEKDFPQKKHNLVCAISEISDMAMMAKHTVSSLFKEDVKAYFDEQNIIYTPDFIAKGTTGIEFNFDFQIARKQKE